MIRGVGGIIAWLTIAAVLIGPAASAHDGPRRILLLHAFDREFAALDAFMADFRTELDRNTSAPVQFFDVSLQPTHFQEPVDPQPVIEYVRSVFAAHPVDLIVPVGGAAAAFAQQHRSELFPSTPMLLAATDARFVQTGSLTPRDGVVSTRYDPGQIVNTILSTLPRTKHLFVVIGTSPLEQVWRDALSRELQRFAPRLTIRWADRLSSTDMIAASSALPPESAILFALWLVDGKGVPTTEEQALNSMRAVANAPIFGVHSTQLGRGIIGGSLMDIEELGRNAARAASRLLQDETPGALRLPTQVSGPPMFDARELRRWQIPEATLPPGSVVQFREPSVWDRYKWPVSSVLLVCLAQALLILALITNRRKRLRAEASLAQLSRGLMKAQEEERAWIGRELHEDLSQRIVTQSFQLETLARSVSGNSGSLVGKIAHEVADIARAAQTLSRRVHSPKIHLLGLGACIESLCREVGRDQPVDVTFQQHGSADGLAYEVRLAIFRVVQEALNNAVRHSAAQHVRVVISGHADHVEIVVDDDGCGFDAQTARRARGLGLTAMKQRLALVNGTMVLKSRPRAGTTIRASVPRAVVTSREIGA
jgi:signal transduction histidine kinase